MPLISGKVGEFSVGEAFGVGISKAVTEQVLAPFVGNGTYWSGGTKLILAYVIPKMMLKNQFGKMIGTGLAVDGVEDMVNRLFGDKIGGMGAERGMVL